MRHLGHHAADCRRIRTLHYLIQSSEAKPAYNSLVLHWRADRRPDPLQLQLAITIFLRRHHSSSAALPRMLATNSLFLSFLSASNVALITLCGLVVPIDFVSTF